MKTLFQSLKLRKRPEDIAEMIQGLLSGQLPAAEQMILDRVAKNSLKKTLWGYSSMAQTFARPVGAEAQVRKAIELFKLDWESQKFDTDSPAGIIAFLKEISGLIGKEPGKNSFLGDRLNKYDRRAKGLDWSKRQYNKRFRLLVRLEKRVGAILEMEKKTEYLQMAKNGLARAVTWTDFSRDLNTACFIAYYTARCNLRSEFTIFGQQRPFDKLAQLLYNRATRVPEQANYLAMAHVFPAERVLGKLSDAEKGELLGIWTRELGDLAAYLEKLWKANRINRKTMIVRRGNDSSTWNAMAGAWNKARDAWMNLIYAMGLEPVLDEICFGKCLRLMAADVAAWHKCAGGGLEPNTAVWNRLPLPWEVFQGKAVCTRKKVEALCRNAGLDPYLSGWVAPRTVQVAAYRPTPELVHGVAIGNPFLAKVLKQNKYFSGKNWQPQGA